MANLLYANNAAGTLAAGITNVSTSLTLNPGQAALFPAPAPPQVFYVTLTDAATQTLIEIVKVTAVSGNVFSIVRAQDGTSALSWNAGDIVSQRTIALELRGFENAAEGLFAAQAVPITPSTTLGIVGTTAADNANAGSVGEFITQTGSTGAMTNGVPINTASVALSAGDWDVWGVVQFIPSGPTQVQGVFSGLSTTTNNFGPIGTFAGIAATLTTGQQQYQIAPTLRFNLSTTTTVYLAAEAQFTVTGCFATGFLYARRVR